jgi:Right handed beta helix region
MHDRWLPPILLGLVALLCVAAPALAHVERTAYWPDPRPDTLVKPAAGGAVPKARSLASALDQKKPGTTRVVCRPDALKQVRAEIGQARRHGIELRPTQVVKLSKRSARALLRTNEKLFARCRYRSIQPAVNDSHNNDRVVIMPGVYTEPASRAVPAFPAECDKYRTTSDHGSGAVSYEYQSHCPNAQALVAVIGRALGPGTDPSTTPFSRPDPHGIPNIGSCIRCNMQIEGSGPSPDDVVIDAGRVESGNHALIDAKKDVGLKVDRADGIVLRNMTVRHAAEHDVYLLELDGYRMERMKFFYAGEYGALMFTTDHGLTDTCEGVGNGDSAVYPGGAPDTGALRDTHFYGQARLNQTITHCDLHHNNLGYSGTMGNATHVVDNNWWDNATGIATDSFYAGGHPGFPQDSSVFENNRIWDNNFNVYGPSSDVKSATPVPIGVGILVGGGDDNVVRGNWIWNNWRRGTMLVAVPDVISCAPTDVTTPKCIPTHFTQTSERNHDYDNNMGRAPDGKPAPNGVDFWWDEFATNTGNCWYSNRGSDGSEKSLTADPPMPPISGTSLPKFLPMDCANSVGAGDPVKEGMLMGCLAAIGTGNWDGSLCEWFAMPAKPGSAAALEQQKRFETLSQRYAANPLSPQRYCTFSGGETGSLSCDPFKSRLS